MTSSALCTASVLAAPRVVDELLLPLPDHVVVEPPRAPLRRDGARPSVTEGVVAVGFTALPLTGAPGVTARRPGVQAVGEVMVRSAAARTERTITVETA
jgi:hypothetical protein